MTAAIEAQSLSKRYGRHYAVQDVSFRIEQGQITGFLGPNGAGKTTTLRMLAGLIRPSAGQGRLLGGSVPGPALMEVGTMIEEPSFYPYMTGRQNLQHAGKLHGGVTDERIGEVLAFVHMENAAAKKVGAYSQGMRQRLGLARAILWKPQVLLLDEPTNGLDPVGIAEIRESLRYLASQGTTILISSHILSELEKLVERTLVIERGKLLFDGSLSQLLGALNEAAVTYRLRATDETKLFGALEARGLEPEKPRDGMIRVSVPQADADGLLTGLALDGVAVTEAARSEGGLESAYLNLLREDGRPQ